MTRAEPVLVSHGWLAREKGEAGPVLSFPGPVPPPHCAIPVERTLMAMHEETRFSLVNDKRLPTDKVFAYQDFGRGTFTYRVKKEPQVVDINGKSVRLLQLEVLSAEIS
jgi:hypothetical protein